MIVLRRYLVLVIVATILGAALAAVYSWSRADVYRATTRLFFTTSAVDVSDVYQATLAGQQRVHTYEVLASDPEVINDALRRAGVSTDAATLQANLHIDVPPGTIIMDIGVDDTDPATAASLANALSDSLIALIAKLERPLGGGPPPVSLTVVQKAVPSATPEAKLDPIFVGVGALAGFVIGCGLAFGVNTARTRQSLARASGEAGAEPHAPRSDAHTAASQYGDRTLVMPEVTPRRE